MGLTGRESYCVTCRVGCRAGTAAPQGVVCELSQPHLLDSRSRPADEQAGFTAHFTDRSRFLVACAICCLAVPPEKTATFVEPMECLPVSKLPEGPQWVYEIKLDGYRAVAVKTGGKVTLYSRNQKPLNKRFPHIVEGLADLPDETVIDGEIVALDFAGRPDFNLLQNFREAASQIVYYAFDLLVYQNRDLTRLPLKERRELMFSALKLRSNRIFASEFFEVSAQIMLQSAKEQGLEGIVGKRSDSLYEPGKRSGFWVKYRLNLGQEFVIGGFTPGPAWDRRDHRRLLPGQGTDLRCPHPKWLRSGLEATRV